MTKTTPIKPNITKPLLIVCDTCIYVKDFRLKNSDWTKLGAILKTHNNAKLVLPKAIEREITKKLEELGDQTIRSTQRHVSDAEKRLINLHIDWHKTNVALVKDIKNYVNKIKEFSGDKLEKTPLPKAKLTDYFERAISSKKPFKNKIAEGGYSRAVNGFRDAVIWESVKEIYKKNRNSEVIFFTTNSTDFSDQETNQLHSQFLSELSEIRKNAEGFHYVQSEAELDPFLREAKVIDGIKNKIKTYVEKNNQAVCNALADIENDTTIEEFRINELSVNNVYKESSDSLLVDCTADFDVTSDLFIDKSEYYSLSEEELKSYSIQDSDWNDHMMWVQRDDNLAVNILATVSKDGSKVEELVINGDLI